MCVLVGAMVRMAAGWLQGGFGMFSVVQPGQLSDVKCEIFPGISQPHAALVVKYISLTVVAKIVDEKLKVEKLV